MLLITGTKVVRVVVGVVALRIGCLVCQWERHDADAVIVTHLDNVFLKREIACFFGRAPCPRLPERYVMALDVEGGLEGFDEAPSECDLLGIDDGPEICRPDDGGYWLEQNTVNNRAAGCAHPSLTVGLLTSASGFSHSAAMILHVSRSLARMPAVSHVLQEGQFER